VIPDLVLLDVTMPGLDGMETLRLLKDMAPAVPVIMLSGRRQTPTVVDAVRLGAFDYLVKPDDPEGLADAALESVHQRRVAPAPGRQSAGAEDRAGAAERAKRPSRS